jgi:protein-tyrosine-phosphatase
MRGTCDCREIRPTAKQPMSEPIFNVLFLCTGNSARSIMAECIMNRAGAGRFVAYSAGSRPRGRIHPLALAILERKSYPVQSLRSKSWYELAEPGAPDIDFVFTVCDDAARESCPVWPGHPMSAHWGIPDPAAFEGPDSEKALAFADAYRMLANRIDAFVNLPIASLDRLSLKKRIDEIGKL